ncbi:flagellar assembly factor FliW [Actinotalea ferrariae CF5-4]|uniref:Flagellar assembly factor FliW n=1 Tax=Actinotalea ferrariae CF5-4 TaxID=948458 RepID=A0A021VV37_9CELL|nr:flagellar assembly protein FliW [Actinotalea ferrariae]EYR65064.1 flagellar assembly factor FliW [Actinotalea ferrariae CF5-4]
MSVLVSVATTTGRDVPERLEFAAPPPGMLDLRRFTLSPLDDVGFLFALRSDDDPGVRLFVVPPLPYFPQYAPRLDAETLGTLGVGDAGDGETEPVLLVVVHPGQDGMPPTANLLAPVVVNPTTGAALQVVLDSDEWPLRAPLGAQESAA